ncbi:DUF4221 family protein [Roseivirga echinicomitans]|uniref:DUF4221 domain-containing protein n=1 Tax=Roseivirga echinicomitans TaxID=296218 RepID=A0A150X0T3_9BACT|nr:DUF4221 family protein [Roseivirga echinicomitans]KYG72341.1 hypothetical protein AWN68_11260 [Roseivirga echinicomitans]
MKNLFLYLTLSALLFSCTGKDTKEVTLIGDVKVVDSVSFFFDSTTVSPLFTVGRFQYIPEENRLAYLNNVSNGRYLEFKNMVESIKLFDFESGLVNQTIPLIHYGRNMVSDPSYFFYRSPDSIWVYPSNPIVNFRGDFQMALMDDKGWVDMRIQLRDVFKRGARPMSGRFGAIVQRGEELIISSYIPSLGRDANSTFIKVDINNWRSDFLEYDPRPYKDISVKFKGNTSWSSFRDLAEIRSVKDNDNNVVSNLPLDHRLWVLSPSGKTKGIEVRSKYLLGFPILDYEPSDQAELGLQVKASGRYIGILFDAKREIYYRITRLSLADIEPLRNKDFQPEFTYTVMAIDKEFNLLAESKFSSKDYLFEIGLFEGPEGIYVLRNSVDENKMVFDNLMLVR